MKEVVSSIPLVTSGKFNLLMATVWYIHHLQYRFGVYLPSRARWSLWCPGCFQSTDSWLHALGFGKVTGDGVEY